MKNKKKLSKRDIRYRAQDLILAQADQTVISYLERDGRDEDPVFQQIMIDEINDLFGRLAKSYGYSTWNYKSIDEFIKPRKNRK